MQSVRNRINIYSYIAATNPYFVKSLAHKYGYEFDKDQQLSTVLEQLVSYEGEPVLAEIIDNHPDKELFMEYFNKNNAKNKDEDKKPNFDLGTYLNFSGQIEAVKQSVENKQITSQTNLMVLAGALLIAFAIITKK
jgi:hypothetical protein